jgi:hypothetical protein
MGQAIPTLVAFSFIETAKGITTTLLAPDAPEVPDLDLEPTDTRRDLQASQAGRQSSRLGSVANAAGVPGGPARVGQPQVILGPTSTGARSNA